MSISLSPTRSIKAMRLDESILKLMMEAEAYETSSTVKRSILIGSLSGPNFASRTAKMDRLKN